MQGELSQEQIDQLLYARDIGRIGCYAEGRIYIVPINYVYDGESIYAQSMHGMKLAMMQANPEVCFEVDQIDNASNWQSIVAWGIFEILKGEEAAQALQLLMQAVTASIAGGKSLHEMRTLSAMAATRPGISIYRVRLTEKTGRFEKTM
jgi:nitroimidazol reductase NimA-like FMN-containing flavoprotein (pyridoxamine 5'-phosphate oxidase superfamily)